MLVKTTQMQIIFPVILWDNCSIEQLVIKSFRSKRFCSTGLRYLELKKVTTSLLRLLKHYRPDMDFDSLPATGQQLMQVDGNDYNNYGFEIPFTPEDYDTSGKQLNSQFHDKMKWNLFNYQMNKTSASNMIALLRMHDNSPIHTARIVRQWFNIHPWIYPLPWPAKSPDLNPIENV